MFSLFTKSGRGIKKIHNTFPILLENAPFCACVFHSGLAQSHTPLNTAVFMAYCNSGEEQIGKENMKKKKKKKKSKEKKTIQHRVDENTETQMVKGEAERTKEAIHSVLYCTP